MLRRCLTYSNVMSTLAVALVLGGGVALAAGLAKNSVGSKQIKAGGVKASDLAANSVNSSKVADGSLRSADFASGQLERGATGASGPAGATGTTGPQGPTGPTGSQAASAMSGHADGLGPANQFFAPSGVSTATTTEADMTTLTPDTTIVARDLSAEWTAAPGGANTRFIKIRVNGASSAVQCSVTGAATSCQSPPGTTVTIPAGSDLVVIGTTVGAPAASDVKFGWRATTP